MSRRRQTETEGARRLPVPAERLATVDRQHVVWSDPEASLEELKGASYVRVQPPVGASDEDVARVVARASGTAAVRVDPRPRAKVVTGETKEIPQARVASLREVVRALLPSGDGREELLRALEECLAFAGL